MRLQITGDDTSALQAVLDADVWRKVLLRDQSVRYTPSLK
jgi:ATP-binding cassette subfamily F protein 3